MNKTQKLIRIIIIAIVLGILTLVSGAMYAYSRYNRDLPDYQQLKSYNPLITTRIYASNGELLKEFSKENRVFVSIDNIPQNLINAFLAAEDSNFYKHSGIDIGAIVRASVSNSFSFLKGDSITGGASTITQQVVKNFLLTNERTLTRKIKEAILAFKITKQFTKDQILELYLNQIYLGSSSYGVASASQAYFDKSIDELTIEEVALLATLPKAPSKLDPRKNIEKAKVRRDWVIDRMLQENFITRKEAREAKKKPIILKKYTQTVESTANTFSDAVKKELIDLYGSDKVFESGIMVRTTLDPKMQKIAKQALQNGIESYDRKHGYRGALDSISITGDWNSALNAVTIKKLHKDHWLKAVVLNIRNNQVDIGLDNQVKGVINLENVKWARKYIGVDSLGPKVKSMSDVFKIGDVILVENIVGKIYDLKQIPSVNGAVMAMDPHSGKVLAMLGGYIDADNQFNRATQAKRQPGSVLKTFGFIAALENGFTPASVIIDEPITLDQGYGQEPYSPANYSNEFYGPTTLRTGLEKSINVTTVILASQVGLDKVVDTIKKFKINDNPDEIYSLVLGSTETTLARLVTAYSMIVNGGKEVDPMVIEKIQDRNGKNIFKLDKRKCNCSIVNPQNAVNAAKLPLPELKDNRDRVTDSATAYQITSMLEGVVKRGTAAKAARIHQSIAGKTGTTNNSYDSWFVGFSPDLVVGVYIGFDTPKTLGRSETGASVALPVFIEVMEKALQGVPNTPFRVPNDIKFVKIDKKTGRLPTPSTPKNQIMFEAFKLNDVVEGSSDEELPIEDENYYNEGSSEEYQDEVEKPINDKPDVGIY